MKLTKTPLPHPLRHRSRRHAAVLAATGLVGAGLAVATTAAPAQAVTVDKEFMYVCHTVAGTLNLGNRNILVRTQFTAPDHVWQGGTTPVTPVTLTLTLPEDLREVTYVTLAGRTVEGYSADSAVSVAINGQAQRYLIGGTNPQSSDPFQKYPSAKNVAVPPNLGDPWIVPTQGQTPPIPAPVNATGNATLSMPAAFKITSTITAIDYNTGQLTKKIPTTLDCSFSPTDQGVAGPNPGQPQIGDPQDPFLLDIPIRPSAASTLTATTTSPRYPAAARVAYKVTNPATAHTGANSATGTVRISHGNRVLATGTVSNGTGAINIPTNSLGAGTTRLTVTYTGGGPVRATTGYANITIAKANTKIKTKKKWIKTKPKRNPKRLVIKAKVNTPATVKADGRVKIVIQRGKKKIAQTRVKVNNKGIAKLNTKKLKKKQARQVTRPGKYRITLTYQATTNTNKSTTKTNYHIR